MSNPIDKKKLTLKGVGQIKKAIRSSGGVVPNIHDEGVPTTKKASIEDMFNPDSKADTILESLCKTAFIGNFAKNPKDTAKLLALAGGAIVANREYNQDGSLLNAGLKSMAAVPFLQLGAGKGMKYWKNIKSYGKASEYLAKDLAGNPIAEELTSKGINRFSGVRGQHEAAKGSVEGYKEYQALKNKATKTPEELDRFNELHKHVSNRAFDSEYGNTVTGKIKGLAIKGMSKVSPTIKQNLEAGKYTSSGVSDYLHAGDLDQMNSSANINKNLEYLKSKNINLHDVTKDIYKMDHDPDQVFNLPHDEFIKHKAVPGYIQTPFTKSVKNRFKIPFFSEANKSLPPNYKNKEDPYEF